MDQARQPLAQSRPSVGEIVEKRVRFLSFGFFFLFVGFNASQGTQSMVHKDQGYLNLGILYLTFAIASLLSPIFLSRKEVQQRTHLVFILPAVVFIVAILANIVVDLSPAILTAINGLTGLAAAVIWVAQGAFLARCSVVSSQYNNQLMNSVQGRQGTRARRPSHGSIRGTHDISFMDELVADESARFNSLFNSYFQFSGSVGAVLAAVVIYLSGDSLTAARTPLYVTLGCIACVSMLAFFLIPSYHRRSILAAGTAEMSVINGTNANAFANMQTIIEEESSDASTNYQDQEVEPISPFGVLKMICTEEKLHLTLPAAFANGILLSFVFGDLTHRAVEPLFGPTIAGFALGLFYLANSFSTFIWAKVVQDIGRKKTFKTGLVLQVVGILVLVAVAILENVFPNEHDQTVWEYLLYRLPKQIALLVSIKCIAAGDSVYETFIPAVLQTYYSDKRGSVIAMSSYNFAQSLGFSFMFLLDVLFATTFPNVQDWVVLSVRGAIAILTMIASWFLLREAHHRSPFDSIQVDPILPWDSSVSIMTRGSSQFS